MATNSDFTHSGQNIAAGYDSYNANVSSWMNSNGLRANILNAG